MTAERDANSWAVGPIGDHHCQRADLRRQKDGDGGGRAFSFAGCILHRCTDTLLNETEHLSSSYVSDDAAIYTTSLLYNWKLTPPQLLSLHPVFSAIPCPTALFQLVSLRISSPSDIAHLKCVCIVYIHLLNDLNINRGAWTTHPSGIVEHVDRASARDCRLSGQIPLWSCIGVLTNVGLGGSTSAATKQPSRRS